MERVRPHDFWYPPPDLPGDDHRASLALSLIMMEPRPAATIVLVRQSAAEAEVLLVQRLGSSAFGPGAWVFPGGVVDPGDAVLAEIYPAIAAALGTRMSLDRVVAAAYLGAAIREAWEETGVLVGSPDSRLSPLAASERTLPLSELLRAGERLPELADVIYLSRWVTPERQSRRYDTRFFLSQVGDRVELSISAAEHSAGIWISPREALERHGHGELPMMPPTLHTLRSLAEHTTVTGMLMDLRERPPGSYLPDSPDAATR